MSARNRQVFAVDTTALLGLLAFAVGAALGLFGLIGSRPTLAWIGVVPAMLGIGAQLLSMRQQRAARMH